MCYCTDFLTCYNSETGRSFSLRCRSYTCPECGRYNRGRLRRYLLKYIQDWDVIRFWTFTLSSASFSSPETHYDALRRIWRYFVTELRRNRILSESEQNVQYVKVSEPHSSGYLHYHAIFDRYVSWHKVYALWCSAVESVTGLSGKSGGVHVKGLVSAKNAAFYITKYVTKTSQFGMKHVRSWSKSSRVAIFPVREADGPYVVWDANQRKWFGAYAALTLLEFNTAYHHTQMSIFALFPSNSPPEFYGFE